MEQVVLKLGVSKNWGAKKGSRDKWRKRKDALIMKENSTCKFCGIRLDQEIRLVALDGNNTNESESNFVLCCPLCDAIRHCGYAAMHGDIMLYSSAMSQQAIVKKTYELYLKNGKMPLPTEVDLGCTPASTTILDFANFLMTHASIPEELRNLKGFFSPTMGMAFTEFIIS